MAQAVERAVLQSLWEKVVKECAFVCDFHSNFRTIEDRVAELLTVEDEVDLEVAMAKREGKVTGTSINWWKGEVAKIKGKYSKVLKGANKVRSGCLKGGLNVPQRFLMSRKAADLIVDITKILDEGRKFIRMEHCTVPAGLLRACSITASDDLESRVKIMEQVMVALENDGIFIIGICGMVGVGKTKLVDEVKYRVLEEKLFDAAVKVEVSHDLKITEIQNVIAHNLGLKFEVTDEDGRARKLRSRLMDGSRTLVILDNIWNPVPLNRVGLPSLGQGCKIVFTSRNRHMFKLMNAQEKVEVEPLSTSEGRLLFKKIAGEYIEEIANKIADECGGLPLAIEAVASALGGSMDHEVWECSLNQLKESSVRREFNMEERVYSPIKLSYEILGKSHPQAQPLLLLCCLFTEGDDISHQKLVRLAKGLELPEPFDNLVNTSNKVFTLLEVLKKFSLLLPGNHKMTAKMNKVVRDVCLSISSDHDKHRFKVEHRPRLAQFPDRDEQRPYFGISLMFDDQMQKLPYGLVYPDLELLQLQFVCDSLKLPEDFFIGMKGVKVLDIKRLTRWGRFIRIDTLQPQLKFLTNLRTLCLEFCDLSAWDLSLIESLKNLEVLSFFSSTLVSVPLKLKQLTNIKLLDLRCADTPQFIPANILPALRKLENLYLGNFDSWSRGPEQGVQGQGAEITELSSLSFLRVLQVRVQDPQLLFELKEESWFTRLRRYEIAAIRKKLSFREYEIGRTIVLDRINWNQVLNAKISLLLRTTETLTLKATSLKNLFSLCSSLRTFELSEGINIKNIMETGDDARILNKLKHMDIRSVMDLKAICDGDLPRNSLIELQTLKLKNLPELTHLWSQPADSGCLVNLRVFEMSLCGKITCIFPLSVAKSLVQLEELDVRNCNMLEWIVSGEAERAAEKIVFKKLYFLTLNNLPKFRSFFPNSVSKTLTENSAGVEVNSSANENATDSETQGCGWFARKQQSTLTEESPMTNAPVLSIDNIKGDMECLFNQLVDLPTMQKLDVSFINNLEHILDDQTSRESISKIGIMIVSYCEKLLSLAASEYPIRSLQNLEKVEIKNCASMQAMFHFRKLNVENQIIKMEPILNKLETVALENLHSLKHVFGMVLEGIPCLKNLKSLTISKCCSLKHVLSVSVAKMLGNLQDLKVNGSTMVIEIIETDGDPREETDIIQFPQLRVILLESLDSLTSFSSGKHNFVFPQLQDLLVLECPTMERFCRGQVTALKLDHVRVGEHPDQRVSVEDGLNIAIQLLNGGRLSSGEIQEE